jgi:hypothetical protein
MTMTSSPSGPAAESPPVSRRRRALIAGVAVLAAVAALSLIGANSGWLGTDRQDVVAERSAQVMPFDLDATTHYFVPNVEGGLQTVVADDLSDQD